MLELVDVVTRGEESQDQFVTVWELSVEDTLIEGHCPNSELLLLLVFIINNLVKEIIKIMSLG